MVREFYFNRPVRSNSNEGAALPTMWVKTFLKYYTILINLSTNIQIEGF